MTIKARAFAAGILLATQPLLCVAAVGQSATGFANIFPYCAWWTETTATSLNVAFPDTSAAYWTTPLQATPDLVSVTISGQYANARYFSLNAYTNAGASYTCGSAGASSAVADYLIAPDSGSQNPFQTSAAPDGRYTVTLVRADEAPPAPNTIPLYQYPGCQPAPAQGGVLPSTLSFLILRTYLPHDGFGKVALPELTLHFAEGHSVALPRCPGRTTTTPARAASGASAAAAASITEWAPDSAYLMRQLLAAGNLTGMGGVLPPPCGRPGAATCAPELTFFRPQDSATGGLFPNADNKYLAALVQPRPGTVVVVRGKAPTFPPGTQAEPWNSHATNLRYWSLCSNIYRRPYPVVTVDEGGQTILGCAPDLATAQDSTDFYTYVVSHVRDKPSGTALAANSATWLPFSDTEPYARHLLALRNMLGAAFPYSVQNCAAGSDPTSIAACKASMAAYYPEAAECRARTFEAGGTAACFQEYQFARALMGGAVSASAPGDAE